MPDIVGSLGSLQLENFTVPLTEKPVENAADITTLDGTMYTDWVNNSREWTLNWFVLDEAQYDDLRAVYELQFTTGSYPAFSIPYYSIDTPVRMYINEKDIRHDGCDIYNVSVTLREQYSPAAVPSFLLLDNGEALVLDSNDNLTL